MTIRPLEDQFEPAKVAEIKALKKEYDALRRTLHGDSAGYMISGISRCLETGILLGALSLAFSFLDMFVHDLAIQVARETDHGDGADPADGLAARLARQEMLPFERYMDAFMRRGVVREEDCREILSIYRNIGIPLHHILSRGVGAYSRPLVLGRDNLLDRFLARSLGVAEVHRIEEIIEDYATQCLGRIVRFVRTYQAAYRGRS